MVRFADPETLKRVSQADRQLIKNWREGSSLQSRTGRSLVELQHRSVADRISLASDFLSRARKLKTNDPPLYRDAISRYYYATYHAFRAVSFYIAEGDDHQEHSVLPTKLPSSFPDLSKWQNDLKDSRLTRNAADYDVYPKSPSAWRADCTRVESVAELAVPAVRRFLRSEGCSYV